MVPHVLPPSDVYIKPLGTATNPCWSFKKSGEDWGMNVPWRDFGENSRDSFPSCTTLSGKGSDGNAFPVSLLSVVSVDVVFVMDKFDLVLGPVEQPERSKAKATMDIVASMIGCFIGLIPSLLFLTEGTGQQRGTFQGGVPPFEFGHRGESSQQPNSSFFGVHRPAQD